MPLVHYCLIREDLPPGVAAAQLVHAAGESFYYYGTSDKWAPSDVSGTIAVVLGVADEAALLAVEARLQAADADVPFIAIREPDAPWNGQLMSIGMVPAAKERLASFFTGLKLYARPSIKTTLKALLS